MHFSCLTQSLSYLHHNFNLFRELPTFSGDSGDTETVVNPAGFHHRLSDGLVF